MEIDHLAFYRVTQKVLDLIPKINLTELRNVGSLNIT